MNKLRSLLALSIVVFIPFGLMIWYRIQQTTGFTTTELIKYPLLFGGSSIVVIYILKKFLLKEKLSDFNSEKGTWYGDIGWGLLLTVIYFAMFIVERWTLSEVLPSRSNMELLEAILEIRESPVLILLWFGPVLWIGVALYEELIRVFILTSLWKWSEKLSWSLLVILLSGILIGLTHWSQGPYGIVTIGLKSLVAGYYFYKKRRLMPIIYAHVLYDGIQVAILLLTYPNPFRH